MNTLYTLLLLGPVAALEGWVVGKPGDSCTDTCAHDASAKLECESERMGLVNTSLRLATVNVSIASTQGPAAAFACTYMDSNNWNSDTRPYVEGENCYFGFDGPPSTCEAQIEGAPYSRPYSRICCCARVVSADVSLQIKHAATVCPLTESDCGTGTMWLPTAAVCLNSSTASCPSGSWRNEIGGFDVATSLAKPICETCVQARYGVASGMTSAAKGCTKGCAEGKFGNVSGQSIEANACFDCDLWGRALTPRNSTVCVGCVTRSLPVCTTLRASPRPHHRYTMPLSHPHPPPPARYICCPGLHFRDGSMIGGVAVLAPTCAALSDPALHASLPEWR